MLKIPNDNSHHIMPNMVYGLFIGGQLPEDFSPGTNHRRTLLRVDYSQEEISLEDYSPASP